MSAWGSFLVSREGHGPWWRSFSGHSEGPCPSWGSSHRRQIPRNGYRINFTSGIATIAGIQTTTVHVRHLFRQHTHFLPLSHMTPPSAAMCWGTGEEAPAPAHYLGEGDHLDVPRLLGGCSNNPSRAAYLHQMYIWSCGICLPVAAAAFVEVAWMAAGVRGWPWTLSSIPGCPEFLSSHRFSSTTSV